MCGSWIYDGRPVCFSSRPQSRNLQRGPADACSFAQSPLACQNPFHSQLFNIVVLSIPDQPMVVTCVDLFAASPQALIG